MIVGGAASPSTIDDTVEVLHLTESAKASFKCAAARFPIIISSPALVVLPNQPIVCGGLDTTIGSYLDSCFILNNNKEWIEGPRLSRKMSQPFSYALSTNSWLMVAPDLGYTEIVYLNGTTLAGPSLPRDRVTWAFSTSSFNGTTVMVMGGSYLENGAWIRSDETHYLITTATELIWRDGPGLRIPRIAAPSGVVIDTADEAKEYIVVTGGISGDSYSLKTEMLLVGQGPLDEWIEGPDFPTVVGIGARMATTPDGQSLILSGGRRYEIGVGDVNSESLFRFQCSNGICRWIVLELEFAVARGNHAVAFLPESEEYQCVQT